MNADSWRIRWFLVASANRSNDCSDSRGSFDVGRRSIHECVSCWFDRETSPLTGRKRRDATEKAKRDSNSTGARFMAVGRSIDLGGRVATVLERQECGTMRGTGSHRTP